ncbi:MAG: DUF421 domain-containing protein [Sphingomonadaceae bacterium]
MNGGEIGSWFTSFERLQEVFLSALVMYVAIVAMVRIAGKRTSAQMNNFDWIMTVATGALAAAGILSPDVSLSEALVALAALLLCQAITTYAMMRSKRIARLVKARPRLLTHEGRVLADAMRRERVSEAELHAALREAGLASPEEADWVVIEADGRLSVIARRDSGVSGAPLMDDVAGHPADARARDTAPGGLA